MEDSSGKQLDMVNKVLDERVRNRILLGYLTDDGQTVVADTLP